MTDITLQNLETELIQASTRQPVLLDIWAPWCGPCRTLGPLLEQLEAAYEGRFLLAKLNADEQPEIAGQLSQAFGVRSIPFCVLFDQGQPIDGFVGALPEAEVRKFLDRHLPGADEVAADAETEAAEALLAEGDTDAALARLQEAVAIDPANEHARFDYIRLLIEGSRTQPELLAQARQAYEPVAHRVLPNPRFDALEHWMRAMESARSGRAPAQLAAAITADKRDFGARYELAQTHLAQGEFTQALDELLEILMRDKSWHDELARKTYVGILELMAKPRSAPGVEAAAGDKSKLELTGRSAAAAS
ncbi:MAG TPA: tetratricopeptide repeat protein, partial [Burkholderiaceae bacterium]|nr:tetratricopeptide repeat protein [Burkholderiaceae bacterium]